ncbi:CLUMA_CG002824, isoform A [Clunio marinus]|uniref:CLUMA_CG002824, isoform A n=1 Tax=Clunio marinus TaxID=568069 RepID=A0A1J1HLV8_9DIPT|nr:CLUMA_CG002824, isoform A [Clunio marinus]
MLSVHYKFRIGMKINFIPKHITKQVVIVIVFLAVVSNNSNQYARQVTSVGFVNKNHSKEYKLEEFKIYDAFQSTEEATTIMLAKHQFKFDSFECELRRILDELERAMSDSE